MFIKMGIEMAKIRKLFLKIGSFGYTIGCLKADINAGIIIAMLNCGGLTISSGKLTAEG